MWDFLKRQKLQRKGYSCGKKRREQHTSEWVETLRCSPYVRGLILAVFLCGLGLLVRYVDANAAFLELGPGMGTGLLATVLLVAVVHLRVNLRESWNCNYRSLLVFSLVFLHLLLFEGVHFVTRLNGMPKDYLLYLAPAALAPMTLTLLLGQRLGFFAVLYTTLTGMLLTPLEVCFPFGILSAVTGIVGVLTTRRLRKRSELMNAGMYAGLTGIALCMLLGRLEPVWLDFMNGAAWKRFGSEALTMLLTGMLTATIVGGVLPLFEALFRVTTTISWIELADLNHPLLRRMTLEAPGTYHHSLMVANLSEAAAESVGADATVCRVCSYFHDIGKLNKPEYCIENIHGAENPHDDLTPSMSALVVMAHVKDGVDLAIKHKLNRQIIDVIQQHHGNSLVYFFYRRAVDQMEEIKKLVAEGKAQPEDVPEVSESSFRYTGPKPDTKESAIISLADAVESAGRSLTKPTPAKIEQLVDEIIRARIRDGQLDECDLTMRDLRGIRDSFTKTLRTSLHRRIPYPDEKKGAEEEARTERRDTYERDRDRTRTAARAPIAAKQSPA